MTIPGLLLGSVAVGRRNSERKILKLNDEKNLFNWAATKSSNNTKFNTLQPLINDLLQTHFFNTTTFMRST